jgi:hypothetical protein
MTPGNRKVFAVVAACAAAFVVVYLMDHLAAGSVAMPAGGNRSSGAELKAAMEAGRIPFNALLLVLGGWFLAAYVGSTTASRLSGQRGPSLMFAGIFTVAILFTLLGGTHPTWMWIGGLLGAPLIALGVAGQSITVRSR